MARDCGNGDGARNFYDAARFAFGSYRSGNAIATKMEDGTSILSKSARQVAGRRA